MVQNPPDSLIKSRNEIYNKFIREKNDFRICLLNNKNCSNQSKQMVFNEAINSHSIAQKNLRYMSTNKKVHLLKRDFRNPFKLNLDNPNIKNSLTFKGFCSHHDSSLFNILENIEDIKYSYENLFFLAYRTIAKDYIELQDDYEWLIWMIANWKSDESVAYRKELLLFMVRLNNFGLKPDELLEKYKFFIDIFRRYCSINFFQYHQIRYFSAYAKKQVKVQKSLLNKYNQLINRNQRLEYVFKVYKNSNSIAFSLVVPIKVKKQCSFFFIVAIPTKEGSDLILFMEKLDYDRIKEDVNFMKVFNGDCMSINEILNGFREKIAHNIDNYESDFSNRYFLEWNFEMAKIEYFKPV